MYVSIAHKFFCDWRVIALTVHDRVFEEGEKQLIDWILNIVLENLKNIEYLVGRGRL